MDCNGFQAVNWQQREDWGHHGWGRPHGFFFFPPLMLLFGLFILFAIFKTGLWIPLLLIGLFFAATRHHRHGHHEFRREMWEKRKRGGYGPMWGGWGQGETPEKPKNDEYV